MEPVGSRLFTELARRFQREVLGGSVARTVGVAPQEKREKQLGGEAVARNSPLPAAASGGGSKGKEKGKGRGIPRLHKRSAKTGRPLARARDEAPSQGGGYANGRCWCRWGEEATILDMVVWWRYGNSEGDIYS
jgi:hypothetical protein